jgi:hypothetical protein
MGRDRSRPRLSNRLRGHSWSERRCETGCSLRHANPYHFSGDGDRPQRRSASHRRSQRCASVMWIGGADRCGRPFHSPAIARLPVVRPGAGERGILATIDCTNRVRAGRSATRCRPGHSHQPGELRVRASRIRCVTGSGTKDWPVVACRQCALAVRGCGLDPDCGGRRGDARSPTCRALPLVRRRMCSDRHNGIPITPLYRATDRLTESAMRMFQRCTCDVARLIWIGAIVSRPPARREARPRPAGVTGVADRCLYPNRTIVPSWSTAASGLLRRVRAGDGIARMSEDVDALRLAGPLRSSPIRTSLRRNWISIPAG